MSRFQDVLKHLRKQNGLSQLELGEALGIGKSTISMYESGQRKPSFEAAYIPNQPIGSATSHIGKSALRFWCWFVVFYKGRDACAKCRRNKGLFLHRNKGSSN